MCLGIIKVHLDRAAEATCTVENCDTVRLE